MSAEKVKLLTIIGLVVILAIVARVLVSTTGGSNVEQISEEERYRIVSLMRKISYTDRLHFDFQVYIDGEREVTVSRHAWELLHPILSPHPFFYTDVVFVHNEDEAQNFPKNVIVAWPVTEGTWIQSIIAQMHREVNMTEAELSQRRWPRPVVTLEEFGLSYPLTVADLVDNWEQVMELRVALGLFHAAPDIE